MKTRESEELRVRQWLIDNGWPELADAVKTGEQWKRDRHYPVPPRHNDDVATRYRDTLEQAQKMRERHGG